MFTLTPDLVIRIHGDVLNPGEMTGLARDKSLEGALARVENRLAYGLINDAFDLAATYAMAIAQGHRLNDANKRTVYRAMQVCLAAHGIRLQAPATEIGPIIIRAAQRLVDEGELADWLRARV